MLAGLWIATRIHESRSPSRPRAFFASIIALLFLSQTWWYAAGREASFSERSPRALVQELIEHHGIDPSHLATFEFRMPAVDFYVGHAVQPVGEIGMRESMSGIRAWSVDELVAHVKATDKPITILFRLSGPDALGDRTKPPAADRLAHAGLMLTILNTKHRFITDSGRSTIGAAIISSH